MATRTVTKRAHIKFYDKDIELHTEMRLQAVRENTTFQDLVIKACREYLKKTTDTTKE